MTVAKMIMVVCDNPLLSLLLLLLPPLVVTVEEVTGIPAIELANAEVKPFCCWTAWLEPGVYAEFTSIVTLTDP